MSRIFVVVLATFGSAIHGFPNKETVQPRAPAPDSYRPAEQTKIALFLNVPGSCTAFYEALINQLRRCQTGEYLGDDGLDFGCLIDIDIGAYSNEPGCSGNPNTDGGNTNQNIRNSAIFFPANEREPWFPDICDGEYCKEKNPPVWTPTNSGPLRGQGRPDYNDDLNTRPDYNEGSSNDQTRPDHGQGSNSGQRPDYNDNQQQTRPDYNEGSNSGSSRPSYNSKKEIVDYIQGLINDRNQNYN